MADTKEPVSIGTRRFRNYSARIVGACASLFILTLVGAATCRPSSYRPRAIDYALLPSDRVALADTLQLVADRLNAGQDAEITLDEARVNRWIAARNELWPAEQLPSIGNLSLPQMRFLEGQRLELSAIVTFRAVRVIGSMEVRIELSPGGIRFVPRSAAIGRLPVPIAWVRSAMRDIEGVDTETSSFSIGRRGVWPNGHRAFEVSEIEVSRGRLRVVLKPTAP